MVVTIVVLLILAGITLTYVLGDNSVFKQASNAKLETELAKIEEKAGLIYSDKWLEKVSNNSNEKPTMQEIVEELKNQGDKIEEVAVDGDGVTGISLDRETMTLGFGGTNKIKVTLERSETSTKYYAVVDGKYYEMHFNGGVVTIDRKPSDILGEEGEKITLIATSVDEEIATATLEESTNTITVTATSKAGTTRVTVTYGSHTKTCEIIVRDIPMTTAMEISSIRARIASGYTRWLTAMTTPTDALQEFEWSSSDMNIATVDNKGVVTAKKAGTTTIIAKTIDGSNKIGSCEVTVVENAVDIATLTEIQTENVVAKDINGNLITVPGGFKVLMNGTTNSAIDTVKYNFDSTNYSPCVQDGIVVADSEDNQFVWIPIDAVSTGTTKPADDIRLGRYKDFGTKNAIGNYTPAQSAEKCTEIINIESGISGCYYYEATTEGNTWAQDLEGFINSSKRNGGYYFARYVASRGKDDSAASKLSGDKWGSESSYSVYSLAASRMYEGDEFIQGDVVNSYAWDTACIFIQKYDNNYLNLNWSDPSVRRPGLNIVELVDIMYRQSTSEKVRYGSNWNLSGRRVAICERKVLLWTEC